MAEPTLPYKRKSDPDLQDLPTKPPKLTTPDLKETQEPNPDANDNTSQLPNSPSDPVLPPNDDKDLQNDEDEDQDDDDDDEDEDEEEDPKGKGVLRDDKGKAKMIEEEDDDDDDDDSDDDGDDDDSGDDSDFSDDPLAEVDLDNILPSRTRRRMAGAGVHIAGDTGKSAAAAASSDSDDNSDA